VELSIEVDLDPLSSSFANECHLHLALVNSEGRKVVVFLTSKEEVS
jgi:hypothetical protein